MVAGDRKSFFAEICHFFHRTDFGPNILGLAQVLPLKRGFWRKKISPHSAPWATLTDFSTDSGQPIYARQGEFGRIGALKAPRAT